MNETLHYPLIYVLHIRKQLIFGAARVDIQVFTEPQDLEDLEVRRTDENGVDEYGGVFVDSSGMPVRLQFDFRNYKEPNLLRTGTGTVPDSFLSLMEEKGLLVRKNMP